MSQKNVLIVGMARSGTSMTSAIFARAGYFVANDEDKELRKADEYNPSGYWEAAELIKCNEEIFSAVGFRHGNTWIDEAISTKQASDLLNLSALPKHQKLIEQYNEHSPWIWKDPRLCYTLGYWWPLLDQENTRVLLLKREPLDIYKSFVRLKWRTNRRHDKEETLIRIKNHLESAEQTIKKFNIPYISVNYSDFEKHPEEVVVTINNFLKTNIKASDLGYDKRYKTSNFRGKALKFVDNIGDLLPGNIRTIIKKLIPNFIWKRLNPHRYENEK